MNSRFSGSMGYQRLIKEIKRDTGGGGPPGPDSVGTSQIINGTITTADICDNAITNAKIAHNAVGNTNIISGAITHAKLSSNCVESHNILDRTILGIDISLGQIGEAHFDASFTTNLTAFAVALEEIGDAIKELSRPFGIIRIINESFTDTNFDYQLSIYNAIDDEYDSLATAIRLKKDGSFTHFYQVANKLTNIKLNVASTGGIGVEAFNILQGAELVESDGNELIFCIGESTNYQNIEIGVEVAI
jgi:hypothetical protein